MDLGQVYAGCSTFADCAYDWQTLIAGALALVAAIIAVIFTKQQINLSEKQEDTRRKSREAAARSTLPLALSSLCQYGVLSGVALAQWRRSFEQDHFGADNPLFTPPALPAETINAVERMIEAATLEAVRKRLAQLVSNVQVLATRMDGIARREGGESLPYLEDNIILAARVYAQGASLFEYARYETDDVGEELDPADASAALRQIEVQVPNMPDLRERLNRQLQR
jgi:hypothetical protein